MSRLVAVPPPTAAELCEDAYRPTPPPVLRAPAWRGRLPRRARGAVESLVVVTNLALLGLAVSMHLLGGQRASVIATRGGAARTSTGSFTKSTTTGNQDITIGVDLSTAQAGTWAILFWTSGSEAATGTWSLDALPGFGIVANGGGAISQYAVGTWHTDNVNTAATGRRMAGAAITMPTQDGASTYHEATFVSFPTSTTMRLNWSVNNAFAATYNYVIVYGLTGAKVLLCQEPTTVGNKGYTGAGFLPDLVFLINNSAATAPPVSSDNAWLGFGAFNAAGEQWGLAVAAFDAIAGSDTNRLQRTDSCLVMPTSGEAIQQRATYVSVNSDGFTLNHTDIAGGAGNRYFAALCLRGVSSKLGAFSCNTTSGAQAITTNHGFTVRGLILASYAQGSQTTPRTNASLAVGASDTVNARASAAHDLDAVNPTHADAAWWNNKVLGMGDNQGAMGTWRTMTLTSHTTSSFTVTHDQAQASADQVLYAVLG